VLRLFKPIRSLQPLLSGESICPSLSIHYCIEIGRILNMLGPAIFTKALNTLFTFCLDTKSNKKVKAAEKWLKITA
jgi:hypothetical protein